MDLRNEEMKFPAAEQRGIFGNYFLFAASGGELTPKRLKIKNFNIRVK
jgi:hypothetical protein